MVHLDFGTGGEFVLFGPFSGPFCPLDVDFILPFTGGRQDGDDIVADLHKPAGDRCETGLGVGKFDLHLPDGQRSDQLLMVGLDADIAAGRTDQQEGCFAVIEDPVRGDIRPLL